jgi:hypothetical protein
LIKIKGLKYIKTLNIFTRRELKNKKLSRSQKNYLLSLKHSIPQVN